MAQIINVVVDENPQTINVTVTDALLTASGGGTFIDGFLVKKGAGKTAPTIELTDKISGWIGQVWVAGEVNTIPVTDVSHVTPAVQGEYF